MNIGFPQTVMLLLYTLIYLKNLLLTGDIPKLAIISAKYIHVSLFVLFDDKMIRNQ